MDVSIHVQRRPWINLHFYSCTVKVTFMLVIFFQFFNEYSQLCCMYNFLEHYTSLVIQYVLHVKRSFLSFIIPKAHVGRQYSLFSLVSRYLLHIHTKYKCKKTKCKLHQGACFLIYTVLQKYRHGAFFPGDRGNQSQYIEVMQGGVSSRSRHNGL